MKKKSPILALILSVLFLGGGGQIYCGYFWKGLVLMGLTIVIALLGFGFGGLLPTLLGAMDAFYMAKQINAGSLSDPWGLHSWFNS